MANKVMAQQTPLQSGVYPQDEDRQSPFVNVPVEMCLLILSKLGSVRDLVSFGLACRTFNQISNDESLWRFFYQNHFPCSSAGKPPQATDRCQRLYKDCYIFERNIRNVGVSNRMMKVHAAPNGVVEHIEDFENILCVFSTNPTEKMEFRIFDKANGKCVFACAYSADNPHKLKVFENCLYLIFISKVISFDMKSGECIKTLELEHHGIDDSPYMEVTENRLCRLSEDGTFKIWDITTGGCLQTFKRHKNWITQSPFHIQGNYLHMSHIPHAHNRIDIKTLNLVTGKSREIKQKIGLGQHPFYQIHENQLILCDGLSIHFWDLTSGKCIKQMRGLVTDNQFSFTFTSMTLVEKCLYCSNGKEFNLWDITNPLDIKPIQTLDDYKDNVTYNSVVGNCLYAFLKGNTVKILNLTTRECQTLNFSEEGIGTIQYFTVQGNRFFVCSGNSDCSVRTISIWCIESGKCLHKFNVTSVSFHGVRPIRFISLKDRFLVLQTGVSAAQSKIDIVDVTTGDCFSLFNIVDPLSQTFVKGNGDRLVLASMKSPVAFISNFGSALEWNLSILRQMAAIEDLETAVKGLDDHGRVKKLPEEIGDRRKAIIFRQLNKILNPDIRGRLVADPRYLSEPLSVIMRLQAEVCVDVLLGAVQDENWGKVRQMLDELKTIDPRYTDALYRLLWVQCGRPQIPQKLAILSLEEIREAETEVLASQRMDEMKTDELTNNQLSNSLFSMDVDSSETHFQEDVVGSIWGEKAFHNVEGFDALKEAKLAALWKLMVAIRRS